MSRKEQEPLGEAKILQTDYQGRTFYYPENSMIGECTADGQGWDTVLIPILRHLFIADSNPTVAEVGTNIGGSLLQMEIALPNARFYCFEPIDRFRNIAKKNIEANNWLNVTLMPDFISDRAGEAELTSNPSTASAIIKEYRETIPALAFIDKQTAQATTLDERLAEVDVDFLKIDTDGYEMGVLRGAQRLLERCKPHLFLEFDHRILQEIGIPAQDVLTLLGNFGYYQFLLFSNFGEALAVESDHKKIMELAENTDYFYVDLLAINASRYLKEPLSKLKSEVEDRYTTYPSHTTRPTKKR